MDDRKVLLLANNCPIHQKIIETLKVLNYFSCHPTQHKKFTLIIWRSYEITRCIIIVYRGLLEGYEIRIQIPKNMHVLDVMNLPILTWKSNIQTSLIANCFQHCKIRFIHYSMKKCNLTRVFFPRHLT